MGAGTIPAERVFFCAVIQRTFQQLCNSRFSPNLVTKCRSVSRRGIWKDIFKTFHFRGHLPPKSEIKNRSNRHFTQSRLQVMGCTSERYCLLHVVVQGPGSFRDRSTFLFCMTYSYGVIGCQSFPIFGFWLIFHLQNP